RVCSAFHMRAPSIASNADPEQTLTPALSRCAGEGARGGEGRRGGTRNCPRTGGVNPGPSSALSLLQAGRRDTRRARTGSVAGRSLGRVRPTLNAPQRSGLPMADPLPGALGRGSSLPSLSIAEERTLVERAGRGDQRAIGRLYDAYVAPLYRFCLARVGNETDAE